MSDGNVVTLADFRKSTPEGDPMDQPMIAEDIARFALDTVADQWANELVHELMLSFAERGTNINFDDPTYGKLMEGIANVVRSMTRHHLEVFDEIALTLQKYPDGEISVGVLTLNDDGEELTFVDDDAS